MQGIQDEPGISQFLRLWAKRIANTRSPIRSAVLAQSLRFIAAKNQTLRLIYCARLVESILRGRHARSTLNGTAAYA